MSEWYRNGNGKVRPKVRTGKHLNDSIDYFAFYGLMPAYPDCCECWNFRCDICPSYESASEAVEKVVRSGFELDRSYIGFEKNACQNVWDLIDGGE